MSARHSVENKSIAKLPCTITYRIAHGRPASDLPRARAPCHPYSLPVGGTVGLTKSQSVATAKKRVQIVFANVVCANFAGYVFAIAGPLALLPFE